MMAQPIIVEDYFRAREDDQEIYTFATTPNGRKAAAAADREVRLSVQSYSDRSAANAETFTEQLADRLSQVADLTAQLQTLRKRMRGDLSPAEFDSLQEQFFTAEAQVRAHVGWVLEREQRINGIVEQLADPVAALSSLQAKYPTTRKSYLAPFGR